MRIKSEQNRTAVESNLITAIQMIAQPVCYPQIRYKPTVIYTPVPKHSFQHSFDSFVG